MESLVYTKPGDKVKSSQWNIVVDAVNGPGEYSDGLYTTTTKGTLYQTGTNVKSLRQMPKDLLRAQYRVWEAENHSLSNTAFLQLGPDRLKTLNEFTVDGTPISFMARILSCAPEYNSLIDDEHLSAWSTAAMGCINTYVAPGQNVCGKIIDVAANTSSDVGPAANGETSANVDTSHVYALIIGDSHWELSGDEQLLVDAINGLSGIDQLSIGQEIVSAANIYDFDIYSMQSNPSNLSSPDEISAWMSQTNGVSYIQCHIGGFDIVSNKGSPRPFDIENGMIVRPYYMIGDKLEVAEYDSYELTSVLTGDMKVLALKISQSWTSEQSGFYKYGIELTGYNELSSMQHDQSNVGYSVIPLYLFKAAGGHGIACDFRDAPRTQRFEQLDFEQ